MPLPAFLRRSKYSWLFIVGFVLLCSAFEYGRVMNMRPQPHHLSRQTAALSFTYTYWEKGNAFFDPRLQHLAADDLTTGRTVAECPLLYYAIAQVWRITGPSEFVYRVVMLLLHFLASFALYRALRRILGNEFWALLVPLFFFTSPAVVYFAISFMPDVPAYDLMILGICALFSCWPALRGRDLVLATVLFTTAGLLKLPALMAPIVLLILLSAAALFPRYFAHGAALFQRKLLAAGLLLSVLLVNAIWYSWSKGYVEAHHFPFSHSGTWALWDLTDDQRSQAIKGGSGVMVWQLFDTPAWVMFGGMLVFLLLHPRHIPRAGWVILSALFAGVTLFTLLWFITLDAHEYYYIIPLLLPITVFVLFLVALKSRYPTIFASRWVMGGFMCLFVYHAVYARNNHRMRTNWGGPFKEEAFLPIYHPDEAHFWDMIQYWSMGPCLRMVPYLDSLGIQKSDRIFVATDKTVCAALYLLERDGWVDFGINTFDAQAMNLRIQQGAKYFLYHKDFFTVEPWLLPYLDHQIGEFEGMLIFEL